MITCKQTKKKVIKSDFYKTLVDCCYADEFECLQLVSGVNLHKINSCKMHSLGFVEWKHAQYVRSVFLYSDVRLHKDMFQWQYIYLLSKYTNSCI